MTRPSRPALCREFKLEAPPLIKLWLLHSAYQSEMLLNVATSICDITDIDCYHIADSFWHCWHHQHPRRFNAAIVTHGQQQRDR